MFSLAILEYPNLYFMSFFLYFDVEVDQCQGKKRCPKNARCIAASGSYRCVCKTGFTKKDNKCRGMCLLNSFLLHGYHYHILSCISKLSDINECLGKHTCADKATCRNTRGSYKCSCNKGYRGDGRTCKGECVGILIFFFIVILYIKSESTWMTSLHVDNSSFGVMIILDLVEICFRDFLLQILMNALEGTVVLSQFAKTLLDLISANARKASLEVEHHAQVCSSTVQDWKKFQLFYALFYCIDVLNFQKYLKHVVT